MLTTPRMFTVGTYSFIGNAGLCGIPGLPTCGPHLSVAAKIGISFGALFGLLLVLLGVLIWWKRRANIRRAQKIAACKCLADSWNFLYFAYK